jgi:hypothetical protein
MKIEISFSHSIWTEIKFYLENNDFDVAKGVVKIDN